jgi:hypothetical protein
MIRYGINPAFSENRIVRWGYMSAPEEPDPNPANNDFTLVFNLAPPIPTLSPVGIAVMVLALLAAWVVVRRSSRRSVPGSAQDR